MARLIIPGVNEAFIQTDSEGNQIVTRTILDSELASLPMTDTTYTAGNGLILNDTEFSVDTDKIADTDWVKALPISTFNNDSGYVTDNNYVTGGTIEGTTITLTREGLDDVTITGLPSPNDGGLMNVTSDDTLTGNGTESDPLGVDTDIIADTEWVKDYVANNSGETYTAGTGLSLNGNEFSVDEAFLDSDHRDKTSVQITGTSNLIQVQHQYDGVAEPKDVWYLSNDTGIGFVPNFLGNRIDIFVDTEVIADTEWVKDQGFVTTDTNNYVNGGSVSGDTLTLTREGLDDLEISGFSQGGSGYQGNIGFGLDTDGGTLTVDTDKIADTDWVKSEIDEANKYVAINSTGPSAVADGTDSISIGPNATDKEEETAVSFRINGNPSAFFGSFTYPINLVTVDGNPASASNSYTVPAGQYVAIVGGQTRFITFIGGANVFNATTNINVTLADSDLSTGDTVTFDGPNDIFNSAIVFRGRARADSELSFHDVNSIYTPSFQGGENQFIAVDSGGNWSTAEVPAGGYRGNIGSGLDTDGGTLSVDTTTIATRTFVTGDFANELTYVLLDTDQASYTNNVSVGTGQAYLNQNSNGHTLIFVDEPHNEQLHRRFIKVTDSETGNYSIYPVKYTNDFHGGSATEFVCGLSIFNSAATEVNEDANTFIIEHDSDGTGGSSFSIGYGLEHDNNQRISVDTDEIATVDFVRERTGHGYHLYFLDSDYVTRYSTSDFPVDSRNAFASDGSDIRWRVNTQDAFDTDVGVGETIRITYRNRAVDPFAQDRIGFYDVTAFSFDSLGLGGGTYTLTLAFITGHDVLSDNANARDSDGQYFIYISEQGIGSVPFDGHHSGFVVAPAGSARNNTHFLDGTGNFTEVITSIDTDDFLAGSGIQIEMNGERVEISTTAANASDLFRAAGDTEALATGVGSVAIGDNVQSKADGTILIGNKITAGEPARLVEFNITFVNPADGVNPVTAGWNNAMIGGQPASDTNSHTFASNTSIIITNAGDTTQVQLTQDLVFDTDSGTIEGLFVENLLQGAASITITPSSLNENSIGLNMAPTNDNQLAIGDISRIHTPQFTGGDFNFIEVDASGDWTTHPLVGLDLIPVFNPDIDYVDNQYVTQGSQIFRANKDVDGAVPWVGGVAYTAGSWVKYENEYYIAAFNIPASNTTPPDSETLWGVSDLIFPGGQNTDWDALSREFGGTDLLMIDDRGNSAAAHAVDGIALGSDAVAGSLTPFSWSDTNLDFANFGFVTLESVLVNGATPSATNSVFIPSGTSLEITQGALTFSVTTNGNTNINGSAEDYTLPVTDASEFIEAAGSSEYGIGIDSIAIGRQADAEHNHSIAFGRQATTDTDNQFVLGGDSDEFGIHRIRTPHFRPAAAGDDNYVTIDTDGRWALAAGGSGGGGGFHRSVYVEADNGDTSPLVYIKHNTDDTVDIHTVDSEYAGETSPNIAEVSITSEGAIDLIQEAADATLPFPTDGTIIYIVTDTYTYTVSGSPNSSGNLGDSRTAHQYTSPTHVSGSTTDTRAKTVSAHTLSSVHTGKLGFTMADTDYVKSAYTAGLGINKDGTEFSVNNGDGLVYRGSDSDLTVDDNVFATREFVQSAIHNAVVPTEFDTDRTDADTLYVTDIEHDRLRVLQDRNITANRTYFNASRGHTVYQAIGLQETDLRVFESREGSSETVAVNSSENWSAVQMGVYNNNGWIGDSLMYNTHVFQYNGHTKTTFYYEGSGNLFMHFNKHGHNLNSRYAITCRLQLIIVDDLSRVRSSSNYTLVSNSNEFQLDIPAGTNDNIMDGISLPSVDSDHGHVIQPGQYVVLRFAAHIDHFDNNGVSDGNSPYAVVAGTPTQTIHAGSADPTTLTYALYLSQQGELRYKDYVSNPDQDYRVLDTDGQIPHLKVNAGFRAEATGSEAVALGGSSEANNSRSVAIGFEAATTADNQLVIGSTSAGNGITSIVTPQFNSSSQANFVQIDTDGNWSTNRAFAAGPIAVDDSDAFTDQDRAFAFGAGASVTGKESGAVGYNASVTGDNSVAIGSTCVAGYRAIALGQANADTDFATAIGWRSGRYGDSQLRLGRRATCIGAFARAVGADSTAMGVAAQADGDNSFAMGRFANSDGSHSTAIGRAAEAEGDYSIAIGAGTDGDTDLSPLASGEASIAIGRNTDATQAHSVALGQGAQATHEGSVAIGLNTATTDGGQVSFAGGNITHVKFATWTTSTRPNLSLSSAGSMGFNTTTDRMEFWTGTTWMQLDASAAPSS